MELENEPRSRLYDFDSIDHDEFDTELAKLYARHCEAIKNKSEIELHNYLQDKSSQNKKEYNDMISALLYGALTESPNGRMYFQHICFVNRDHFSVVVNKLQVLVTSVKFQQLRLQVREQMFWLISELTNLTVKNVDILYLYLMRQIRGGDISQSNLLLCDQILKLCELHKSWLDINPKVIATFVYTYLRVITDHSRSVQLLALQQKEIQFVISLLREKWMLCVPIGRDLIRILHDLSSVPEFSQFWNDLLNNPQKLSPRFKGIDTMLKTSTPKEFLKCRLTPDMECKLLYIVQNLRINHYQRNLNWFIQRFLSTPESEPFYVDIIRYLVAGWYPSNQILQSDIVPRYVIIGSLMRSIKSKTVAANVKTALIFDWLFFTPTENIMFIEPAMLLMERSVERYPLITAEIMEFLKYSVDKYFPPMKDYMVQCVACGMQIILSKGVIRSLIPIYKCPKTDATTRGYMQSLFSEFLVEDHRQQIPALPASVSMLSSITPSTSLETMPQKSYLKTESTEVIKQGKTDEGDNEYDNLIQQKQSQPLSRRASLAAPVIKDDDEVDAFLYGESDKSAETSEREDEKMSNIEEEEEKEEEEESSQPVKESDESNQDMMEGVISVIATEDNEYDDEEDEVNKDTEGIQSNQSYWIFGDSLKRFKESCSAARASQKANDQDEYRLQIVIAKRSLKEILAVFLRMAIPAESLALAIRTHICNIVAANMLSHADLSNNNNSLEKKEDENAVLTDDTKDVFDLIMIAFWKDCDTDALKNKIIQLIGYISHNQKKKSRRHIIGMRWWSFIANKIDLNEDIDSTNIADWFPKIVNNYKAYVMHAYNIEKATIDQNEYLKEYLKGDLQMLAEQNVILFNNLIPLLYRYFADATLGNLEVLKLTLFMLLPDTMGKITFCLHYGSLQIFGDKLDKSFFVESFSLATYEMMCCWQLLAAELQGRQQTIEDFFQTPQIIDVLKTNFKNEIVPSLFSILSSVPPSKPLLYSIIQIVPDEHNLAQSQVQFVIASLQYWANNLSTIFLSSLSDLIISLVDQIESEEEVQSSFSITTLLSLLNTWWSQKSSSEFFKRDRKLLANIAKLGDLVDYSCPKDWLPELTRKKKRSLVFDSSDEE